MSSIEDLKTTVSSRLGFARANTFLVMMPNLLNITGNNTMDNILGQVADLVPRVPGLNETLPSSRELNILCKNVTLPGKQVLTGDRRIGMEFQKVAYGYAVEDVSMTFHVLNDYGIVNYLNAWRERTISEDAHTAQYKSNYQEDITIYQLRKPVTSGSLAQAGPISLDLDIGGGKVYGVKLKNAFPTTVSTINFSNELDGLIEVTVAFSYTNWHKVELNVLDNALNLNLNVGQLF